MKMYHFKYASYGNEYTVLAADKAMALYYLLEHLFKVAREEDPYGEWESIEHEDFAKWHQAAQLNKLPEGYTCEEYTEGQVVETEIC